MFLIDKELLYLGASQNDQKWIEDIVCFHQLLPLLVGTMDIEHLLY
jgi:hypothetical protein